MAPFSTLVVRDDQSSSSAGLTPTIVTLLAVLFALVMLGIVCTAALMVLRSVRRRRAAAMSPDALPATHRGHSRKPSHRGGMTIFAQPGHGRGASVVHIGEKQAFLAHHDADYAGPHSPSSLPEIHITLPEEEGDAEKPGSRRVVVVRIGDNGGVGLEPISEPLPPYQQRGGEWTNLDLERIGGLTEKVREDKRFQ